MFKISMARFSLIVGPQVNSFFSETFEAEGMKKHLFANSSKWTYSSFRKDWGSEKLKYLFQSKSLCVFENIKKFWK